MRVRLIVFALGVLTGCALFSSPNPPPPAWLPFQRGLPTHATILALAVDPHDSQRVYAGAYDTTGVYLSTDQARTWHTLDAGLDRAPVLALHFAGNTLLAGTTAGLYRLGADRWENVGDVPAVAVNSLARDAAGAMYLSTDGRGIMTSADGGRTWRRVPGLEGEIVLSVAALDARTMLAGTSGHGAFLTRDGGATWRALDGFGSEYVSLIAVDPRDARTVYLRTRGGLYRSRDAGESWQRLLGGIQTEIVHALLFDFVSPRLYAATGGRGVFATADGETWDGRGEVRHGHVSGGLPPGVAALALAQVDAHTLLAGTQNGVYLTRDDGGTWQAANDGLGVPQLHALALDSQSGELFAATEDGLYRASPPGDFVRVGGAALSLPVLSLALAPDRIYAGTYRRGIFVSRDGGASWDPAGDIFRGRLSAAGLAIDPRNVHNLFARVLFERIYKSTDLGDTWHSVWTGMPDDAEVETMSIAPNDPQQMFAGTNDGIYYSGDSGETWARRGLASRTVFAIWIDPRAPHRLLAGATDGVYRSDDAGDHWLASGLAAITVTALVQNARGDFYAGTKYTGVWVSRDDGRTWVRLGAGLDEASVIALAVDNGRGALYAATTRGLVRYQENDELSLSLRAPKGRSNPQHGLPNSTLEIARTKFVRFAPTKRGSQ